MGLPSVPGDIPEDRLPFVAMRPRRGEAVTGEEDEMELYYTDTGEPVAARDGSAQTMRDQREPGSRTTPAP